MGYNYRRALTWQDYVNNGKAYKIALCQGRHPFPTNDAVFPTNINVLDFDMMETTAAEKFASIKEPCIQLYVSGLSQALVACINAAKLTNKTLVLMHWDNDSEMYRAQSLR